MQMMGAWQGGACDGCIGMPAVHIDVGYPLPKWHFLVPAILTPLHPLLPTKNNSKWLPNAVNTHFCYLYLCTPKIEIGMMNGCTRNKTRE